MEVFQYLYASGAMFCAIHGTCSPKHDQKSTLKLTLWQDTFVYGIVNISRPYQDIIPIYEAHTLADTASRLYPFYPSY